MVAMELLSNVYVITSGCYAVAMVAVVSLVVVWVLQVITDSK